MREKSLVLMKPDTVKRGIVGEILHRFERAGLKIVGAKLVRPDENLAFNHYPSSDEWKRAVGMRTVDDCEKYGIDLEKNMGTKDPIEIGEKVKQWNMEYLMSGPVLALVFEGAHAVERVRSLVGATVPVNALVGTIRGDFSLDSAIAANRKGRSIYNLIHASGSLEEAILEIDLWFRPEEIMDYENLNDQIYKY
uniref:nucleoside-diphosphate kinase n=1 Tax=candidate division WWE3 bacterium TaxID=2053526 RepID=A0A7C4TKB8_UNCKA